MSDKWDAVEYVETWANGKKFNRSTAFRRGIGSACSDPITDNEICLAYLKDRIAELEQQITEKNERINRLECDMTKAERLIGMNEDDDSIEACSIMERALRETTDE